MDSKNGARDFVGIRKSLPAGQSLGELEAQILDIIWGIEAAKPGEPVSTSQVFKKMYPLRELSYSTNMLTMRKLARKGILEQTRTGNKQTDAFVYKTVFSRQELGIALMSAISKQVNRKTLDAFLSDVTGEDKKAFSKVIGMNNRVIGVMSKKSDENERAK